MSRGNSDLVKVDVRCTDYNIKRCPGCELDHYYMVKKYTCFIQTYINELRHRRSVREAVMHFDKQFFAQLRVAISIEKPDELYIFDKLAVLL